MTHTDIIKDADAFFEINPITRVITNKTPDKTKVMQYDHNSERFTFSMPQFVEGHDMANCSKVEVHYININTNTKEETRGLYEVKDVQMHPEESERIIFSWLLSQNVTRDAGVVHFIVRFSCVAEDGVIDYAWSSEIFKAISVSQGIYNADVIVELYADVLEQWKQELFDASAEGVENINTAKAAALAEVQGAVENAVTEEVRESRQLAYACKVENTKSGKILYEYKIVAGNKYKVTNNGTSYLNARTLDGSGTDVDILPTTAAGKSTVFIATKDAVTFSLYFGAAGSAEIENVSLRVPVAEEKITTVENIIGQAYRQSELSNFKWVIGSIEFNSGKDNNTNTNRIRTGFIPVTGVGCTVTLEGDGRFCVWEYASNDVEGCISDYEITNANWISGQYTVIKNDCKYIRIAVKKTDNSVFDEDSITDFGGRVKITQLFNVHRAVGRYVSPVKESFHYDGTLETYSLENKLETIYAKWDELTENYPNIITKKVLGNVGGKEIRSYTITPTPLYSSYSIASNSCEPLKILYISSIHGSEGAIAIDDFALFKNLVANHKPSILWDNCVFEIIPVANPVGYDANDRLNGNGININRNFPDGWVYVNAEEDWYNASGDEPCSEYETQLLMDFVKSHPDAFLVINRHGTDPWGVDGLAGYAASKYQSDIETIIASHSATDTMLSDMYSSIYERNTTRRAYSVLHSNNFAGTFDRWFNSIGYHGYLLEFNDRTSDDPYTPNETVRRMNITAIANLLSDSVINNRGILGNNTVLTSHYE